MITSTLTYMMMLLALCAAESDSNDFQTSKYDKLTTSNGYKSGLPPPQLEKPQKIFGGKYVVSIKKYPYMVFIHTDEAFCGGTILDTKYVLTAAHCIRECDRDVKSGTSNCTDIESKSFTIKMGSRNPNKSKKQVKVKRYFIHPKFQTYDEVNKCEYNYDIAILELKKPIKFSKTMSAVNLPTSVNNEDNMKNCEMVGWGLTEEDGGSPSFLGRRLKYTSSHVISIQECIDHLKISEANNSIYPDNVCRATHMCTIDPKNKRGHCHGDSGGPLICNGVQVGIISMSETERCFGPHAPSVYERVDVNLKWIKQIIAKV